MPTPSKKELKENNQKGFISRCIPMVMHEHKDEGMKPNQAAAICYSMWKEANKNKKSRGEEIVEDIKKQIDGN